MAVKGGAGSEEDPAGPFTFGRGPGARGKTPYSRGGWRLERVVDDSAAADYSVAIEDR